MKKIAILGSTRGSNLAPLFTLLQQKKLPVEMAVVISDRPEALILEQAKSLGLNTEYVSAAGLTRADYAQQLTNVLQSYQIDLIVLLGFMRILDPSFTGEWQGRIINVHPSLLPKHAGLMDLAVHAAAIDSGENETGCTVHVVEAEVDAGPILIQKRCHIEPNDTPESLKARVQKLEVIALLEAIQLFC